MYFKTNNPLTRNSIEKMSTNTTSQKPFHTPSLYVGDLAPDVTEAFLYELFREVGPITSIKVCRDAITKKSLGYAYVNFQNLHDAERAIDTLNYTAVKERPIRIMWAQRDPSIRKSGLGNIFIKNLDKSIDNRALYDTFSAFGNILSCKVEGTNTCKLNKDRPSDKPNESLGYGYVHFETQEAAEKAIAKVNGMLINGKQVYVGPFIKRSERLKKSSEKKFTNVYINNLPRELEKFDEKKLKDLFEKYGETTSVVIARDKDGQSRGFGFCNFKNHEDAKKAVDELNGIEIEGKKVYVGRAQKKDERREELRKLYEQKYQGVNLYIKNLEDGVDDKKLEEMFSKFGKITSAKVMTDESNNSKGFGFVCFSTPEEATKALTEMNGRMVGSKPLYVSLAQRKDVRRAQLEAQYAQRNQLRQMQPGMPQMFPQPVFYPQPGMQGQRPANFVYTPHMVRPPRWVPQGQQVQRGGYPPMGQFPQKGGKGVRRQQNGAQQKARGYKYNQNARNKPEEPQQQQRPVVPPIQTTPVEPQQQDQLTPEYLAQCSPRLQKQLLGERLFPLVHLQQPELASKITGMLLEMDNSDILHLLESEEALNAKITEAVNVLKAHAEKLKQESEQQD